MSYLVDVDPVVFDAASTVFGRDMAGKLETARQQLTGVLSSSNAMAGSDQAGTSWSEQYDPAAQDTVSVMGDLVNACSKLAAMLQRSGFNHGMAEAHSDPSRSVPTPADTTTYVVAGPSGNVWVPDHRLPSAAGGDGSAPTGWGLVEHAVGYLWPNGNPGKLRTAAAAWSKAAGSLDAVTYYVPEATEAISYQRSPEIDDAVTVCNSMRGHIELTASNCRALSHSCNQMAAYTDTAHQNIENELKSFVEWSAGTEIVGGIISVFTAGTAEAPTQAVEASRIAITGSRIAKIIETMIEAVNGVLETIGALVTKVSEVASKLKAILGAKLSEVATTLASRLPALSDDTGAIALGRLEGAASRTWRAGDDVMTKMADGREPSWGTIRSRYWRNQAADPEVQAEESERNLARMKRGLAPQRYNPRKPGMESMELSHEPVPRSEGGTKFTERWPEEHEAVDPQRHLNYQHPNPYIGRMTPR